MRLSPVFLPVDHEAFTESVVQAEAAGFERVWVSDSQLIWEDVYVFLTLGLAATERAVFGTLVTNTVTRHYSVACSAHATLDRIHPGRIILGLGRGDSSVRTVGLKPVTTKEYEAIVPRMKALMAGETVEADGHEIRITWAKRRIPLLLSASGPTNLRLAGAHADIVQLQVGIHPEAVRWGIDHVHAGARDAGRDPDDIEISLLCGMSLDDDIAEARDRCRWAASSAANHLRRAAARGADLPDVHARLVRAHPGRYDYYAHAEATADHTAYVTDEMVDAFAFTGSPENCIEQMRELAALGVDEIAAAHWNARPTELHRVADTLLPAIADIGAADGGQERRPHGQLPERPTA